MKKLVTLILSALLLSSPVFTDEVSDLIAGDPKVDLSKEITVYDNAKIRNDIYKGDLKDKTATIKVEFIPMVEEARIYYNTMYVNYDTANAIEIIHAALEYYTKEKQYRNYQYIDRGRERYYKGNRGFNMAQYSQHVQMIR